MNEEEQMLKRLGEVRGEVQERAEKLNAELQEELKTPEDKWKTVLEFAERHGMKRTNKPLPPDPARVLGGKQ